MEDKFWELIDEARTAGHGPAAISLLEEAVRIADSLGDVSLGMTARDALVDAGYFGGHPERSLIAFSWMIARYDENPDAWDAWDVLWKYKWIIEHFPFMHQIDLTKVERTLDDMATRFDAEGHNQRPVLNLRAWNACWAGHLDEARGYRQEWLATSRDSLADCVACEVNYDAWYAAEFGDDQAALAIAAPILAERQTCAEIPHVTFGWILPIVLQRRGRGVADAVHRRGYDLVRRNRDFVMEVGQHIAYASHVGNLDEALQMTERHLPWIFDSFSWLKDGHLVAAAEGAVSRARRQGRSELPIRLPRELDFAALDGAVDAAELEEWLSHRRGEIAEAFDERNGTTAASMRLERIVRYALGEEHADA